MARPARGLIAIIVVCVILFLSPALSLAEEKRNFSFTPDQGLKIEPLDLFVKLAGTLVFQGSPNPNNAGFGFS